MKVQWVVEDQVFDEDLDPLIEEIKRQGMAVDVIKYIPFQQGKYDQFPDDQCILCYGSLNLIRQLQKDKPWVPGSWCTLKNFECTTYYAHLGKYLFNDDYVMMPLAELKRRKDEVYNLFCEGPTWRDINDHSVIFVRPSSGFKSFTGKLLEYRHFDKDFEWFDESSSPESMVVISSAKAIHKEWRVVIADRKVIASSLYKRDGKNDFEGNAPAEVLLFAAQIALLEWQPDPMYVIDIIDNYGELYLMEINSFSCSGLYHCDVRPVVEHASRLALAEWEEYHQQTTTS